MTGLPDRPNMSWWEMDLSHWPGPVELELQWADPIGDIRVWMNAIARGYGKSSLVMEGINKYFSITEENEKEHWHFDPMPKQPSNHGPRSVRVYDRKGN